ncbi:hypothetical protein RDI58_011863 [Solanum bulbocastanum]|uniref:Uncharacterized protein n=1 Tax=Solanum bulbocastanum TaxID=147425 RepID=A0AAN8TW07_SOLBU
MTWDLYLMNFTSH